MGDFALVRANLFRKTLRTILMIVAIFIAFFLFGVLGAFNRAFYAGADVSAANRLITINKINFTQPLPFAYVNRVRQVEGVDVVTWANWFGGYFQEPTATLQTFAVDPETYLAAYPELLVPEDQRQAWYGNRAGVLVGQAIAETYGWSVGDQVPLKSNIFTNRTSGDNTWQFRVDGIFTAEESGVPTNYVLMHWENFNESNTFGGDAIGWIIINTTSSDLNEQVIAEVDNLFVNSSAETDTATEEAFNKAFIAQLGNIGQIITYVVGAAFATILMIVGTTMIMAIRERTKEIAVLKTIGFPSGRIFRMVLSESMLLTFIGGLLGLGLAWLLVAGAPAEVNAFLPSLAMTPGILLQALGFMVLLGLVTGFTPALNAMRTNIVAAFAKE